MIPKYYDGREYILWKIPGYGFVRQEKKTKIFSETNSGYTWTQFDPKQSQVEVLEGYISAYKQRLIDLINSAFPCP